jgi:hypothetical protein
MVSRAVHRDAGSDPAELSGACAVDGRCVIVALRRGAAEQEPSLVVLCARNSRSRAAISPDVG